MIFLIGLQDHLHCTSVDIAILLADQNMSDPFCKQALCVGTYNSSGTLQERPFMPLDLYLTKNEEDTAVKNPTKRWEAKQKDLLSGTHRFEAQVVDDNGIGVHEAIGGIRKRDNSNFTAGGQLGVHAQPLQQRMCKGCQATILWWVGAHYCNFADSLLIVCLKIPNDHLLKYTLEGTGGTQNLNKMKLIRTLV